MLVGGGGVGVIMGRWKLSEILKIWEWEESSAVGGGRG